MTEPHTHNLDRVPEDTSSPAPILDQPKPRNKRNAELMRPNNKEAPSSAQPTDELSREDDSARDIIPLMWTKSRKRVLPTTARAMMPTQVIRLLALALSVLSQSRNAADAFALVNRRHSSMLTRSETSHTSFPQVSRSGCLHSATDSHDILDTSPIVYLEHIRKVWVLSDLHTDHKDNQEWLRRRMMNRTFDETDLLIIAGDISHNLETLEESLQLLLSNNCSIHFIPGNHEAWLTQQERSQGMTSFDKFDAVERVCHRLGVHTGCVTIGADKQITDSEPSTNQMHPLHICPLRSWYDGSLTIEACEDLCQDFGSWPWVDFVRCLWPPNDFPPQSSATMAKLPTGLAQHFAAENIGNIDRIRREMSRMGEENDEGQPAAGLMTISHFLPSQRCLPDWKDLERDDFDREHWLDHGAGQMSAKFAKVAGAKVLDEQLRSILTHEGARSESDQQTRQHIHIFGHSHRPKDFEWQGIRYVHNPLGKPRERDIHMVSPDANFQLVWETSTGQVRGKTVLRFWEEQGGGLAALRERMARTRRRKSRYKGVAAQ